MDYVILLDQYLDVVSMVEEDDRYDTIEYSLTIDDADLNAAVEPVDEGDYVIVTDIGGQGDVYAFQPATLVGATITKITGVSDLGASVTRVTADGEYYYESSVYGDEKALDEFTAFANIATIDETTLVLDQFGDLVGLAEEVAPPNYAYVAQFGFRHSTTGLNTDEDVMTVLVYFANGESGVYEVDTDKSDVTWKSLTNTTANRNALNGNSATSADITAGGANAGYKGLYDVTILANGKVEIDPLTTDVSKGASRNGYKLYTGHSTIVTNAAADNQYSYKNNAAQAASGTADADDVFYQDTDTVYFFVTGSYRDDDLRVTVINDVRNIVNITNHFTAGDKDETIKGDPAIGTGVRQAFADVKTDAKDIVTVMLIQGIEMEDDHLYYYDEGNYEVEGSRGEYTLTYNLYDADTGEEASVTYDNDGDYFETVAEAQDVADSKAEGFYTIGLDDIEPQYLTTTATWRRDRLCGQR